MKDEATVRRMVAEEDRTIRNLEQSQASESHIAHAKAWRDALLWVLDEARA